MKDVAFETSDGKATLVRFTKTATTKGKSVDYPSYLVLGTDLHIVEESDATTDKNLRAMGAKNRVEPLDTKDGGLLETTRCTSIHKTVVDDPKTGSGHAPRMYSYCVDLNTGDAMATGGWMMVDAAEHEAPLDVPASIRADVARLCHGKQPD